jgi:hypothetical protein
MAHAQITISPDDFISTIFAPTGTQAYWSSRDTTRVEALERLNGQDKTWDLTGRTYKLESGSAAPQLRPYSSSYPMASAFPTATHVAMDSLSNLEKRYLFYQIDETGFYVLGESLDSGGVPSVVDRFSPPYLEIKLPLTYLSTWHGSTNYINLKYGDTVQQSVYGAVDGYGWLVVPSAAPQPVLRVLLAFQYSSGINLSKDTTILFLTKSKYWAQANGSSIDYVEPIGNSGIEVQPVADALPSFSLQPSLLPDRIEFTLPADAAVRIDVLDVTGRTVRTLHDGIARAGTNDVAFDTKAWTPGTYFVRMQTGEHVRVEKMLVIR